MIDNLGVALNNRLSKEAYSQTLQEVSFFNRSLNNGKELKKILNQEDFLNLLITELKNQDPTQPMQDRESIAQMAQFSSLEQMQAMRQQIEELTKIMERTHAFGLLGKAVEIDVGGNSVVGIVEEVAGPDTPQILVNGFYYNVTDVIRVANLPAQKGE